MLIHENLDTYRPKRKFKELEQIRKTRFYKSLIWGGGKYSEAHVLKELFSYKKKVVANAEFGVMQHLTSSHAQLNVSRVP